MIDDDSPDWATFRQEKQARHNGWKETNLQAIRAAEFPFTSVAQGTTLTFRIEGKPWVDFYPHTGRWRVVRPRAPNTYRGGAVAFLVWFRKQTLETTHGS